MAEFGEAVTTMESPPADRKERGDRPRLRSYTSLALLLLPHILALDQWTHISDLHSCTGRLTKLPRANYGVSGIGFFIC